MCHIFLILPVLALPVLWIWPLAVSVPVYGAVAIVSAAVYWYAVLAMRRPVETGREGMIGMTGRVMESSGKNLVVRLGGEIWNARSGTALKEGERVEVIGMNRLILVVRGLDTPGVASRDTQPSPPGQGVASA